MARFYPDRPDVLTPIRWYFTDEDAPWVGVPNLFNARVWYGDDPEPFPLLGEVEGAPRVWVNGAAPGSVLRESCQVAADVWNAGVPFALADSAPSTPTGLLFCCLKGEGVSVVNSIRSDDLSIIVTPSTGDVNVEVNTDHANGWTQTQAFLCDGFSRGCWVGTNLATVPASFASNMLYIDASAAPAFRALHIVGNIAGVTNQVFSVSADGNTFISDRCVIGRSITQFGYMLCLNAFSTYGGLMIRPAGVAPFAAPALTIKDNSFITMFEIAELGEIRTNQHDGGTTLGTVVNRVKVYDENGVLLGYLPVYDGI